MFKKKKRLLVLVSMLVGVLFIFAACGDDEVVDDGTTTITVGTWADESFDAAVELFNEKYPDINVELQLADIEDHHDALLTRLAAGGEVPDVAFIEIDYISNLASRGGFVDLNQEPYNAKQYEDILVEYPFTQATTETGELVAMPTDIAPATIFYRHDRLEEIGLDIDDINTFEDWVEAGEKFAASGENRWLLADAAHVYEMMINGSDTDRYFDEDGNLVINSERFVNAFQTTQEIREAGLDAQISAWGNEWFEVLNGGQVLMQPKGAWLGGHLREWIAPETAGKWRAADLPEGYEGPWGGSFAGIPESSDNKEAAWKFIEFMATNEEVQWSNFEIADMYPSIESLYDREEFDEPIDFYGGQKVRRLWADTLQDITGIRTSPYDNLIEDFITSALSEVLEDGEDPATALEEAEELIKRRINR